MRCQRLVHHCFSVPILNRNLSNHLSPIIGPIIHRVLLACDGPLPAINVVFRSEGNFAKGIASSGLQVCTCFHTVPAKNYPSRKTCQAHCSHSNPGGPGGGGDATHDECLDMRRMEDPHGRQLKIRSLSERQVLSRDSDGGPRLSQDEVQLSPF
jgi:hypothetical protein